MAIIQPLRSTIWLLIYEKGVVLLYAYAPVSPELQRMALIDDFNKNELWIVQTTLQEQQTG